MLSQFFFLSFLQLLILLLACLDDLHTRKIHNHLLLILLPIVLVFVFSIGSMHSGSFSFSSGFSLILGGLLCFILAFLLGFPLFYAKVLGGGDVKLLLLFSLTCMVWDFLWILFYSLFWAALLGVFKVLFEKNIREFFFNIYLMLRYRKSESLTLHSLPYSVALLFGWMSFVFLEVIG